jgi:serine phosphatase RsbU (regulator of sigma subunit)
VFLSDRSRRSRHVRRGELGVEEGRRVRVSCTDGIFEALNEEGIEFGAARLTDIVSRERTGSARAIVDAIFETVTAFRGTRLRVTI